jgi:hypothetical protein
MSSSMQVSRTHCASFGLRGSLLGVGEALKREIAGIVITTGESRLGLSRRI